MSSFKCKQSSAVFQRVSNLTCLCLLCIVSVFLERSESHGSVPSMNSEPLWRLLCRPQGRSFQRMVCRCGCYLQWPTEICPGCCSFWPTALKNKSTLRRPARLRCRARLCTLPASWEMWSWHSCSSGCVSSLCSHSFISVSYFLRPNDKCRTTRLVN